MPQPYGNFTLDTYAVKTVMRQHRRRFVNVGYLYAPAAGLIDLKELLHHRSRAADFVTSDWDPEFFVKRLLHGISCRHIRYLTGHR